MDEAITEHKSAARRAFAHYLRTGRIVSGPVVEPLETKFNPYHDPERRCPSDIGRGMKRSEVPVNVSDYLSWKWIFAFSIIFFFQEEVSAQSIISSNYDRCMDRSGGITSNMLDCIGAENKRLDIALDKTYRDIYQNLLPNSRRVLERDQKAWKEKTRRRCERDPDMAMFDGGSYTTVIYSECFRGQMAARIEWLKERFAGRY